MSTQVASFWLAPRLPAMWLRDTLAMLVSSTSMKVAMDTTTATSQGLTPGLAALLGVLGKDMGFSLSGEVRGRRRGLRSAPAPWAPPTCPGPAGWSRSPSRVIFTGTRCTTFTKLPVAFSAGMTLKREPVPDWMESTLPGERADAGRRRRSPSPPGPGACP